MSTWGLVLGAILFLAGASCAGARTVEPRAETENDVSSGNPRVCRTDQCNTEGKQVLDRMNDKVKPCDDFYEFTCGGFIERTELNGNEVINSLSPMKERRYNQTIEVLQVPINDADPRITKIAKTLFRSCLNFRNTNSVDDEINNILKRVGLWPISGGEKLNKADFDVTSVILKLKEIGLKWNLFFDLSIVRMNASNIVIAITKPKEDSDFRKSFMYLPSRRKNIGENWNIAQGEPDNFREFIHELNNTIANSEETDFYPMTISQMNEDLPAVDWQKLISNLTLNPKVNGRTVVYTQHYNYLVDILKLLAKTDKKTISYYVNQESRKLMFMYLGEITDISSSDDELLQACDFVLTQDYSPAYIPIGAAYVREYFSNFSRLEITDIVHRIRDTFNNMLYSADWMEESSKNKAFDKLEAIDSFIGYPDELLNDTELNRLFGDVVLHETTYLENIFLLKKSTDDYIFSSFTNDNKLIKWIKNGHVDVVNAFYEPSFNSINIPVGFIHPIVFDINRLQYMNYGGIGAVIGHEITHGFDNDGRKYNKYGNLEKWWDNRTIDEFNLRTDCIRDQYNNFIEPMTKRKVDGNHTLGENIADNGGFRAGYLAYKEWSEKQGAPEPRLPGLEAYSPVQMYWIATAQTWCSKRTEESMHSMLGNNVHSPYRFRVIGPLSNYKDFADDFQCGPNTNMNPTKKCKVW